MVAICLEIRDAHNSLCKFISTSYAFISITHHRKSKKYIQQKILENCDVLSLPERGQNSLSVEKTKNTITILIRAAETFIRV